MSKKASPTAIGAFVVGAFALAVAGVVLLGSGRFFQKTYPLVSFFEGSVNGLSVGAPVKFKGVDIGAVTHIFIQIDPKDQNARIPVYLALDLEKMRKAGVMPRGGQTVDAAFANAIAHGLRSQLQTESILTGVLFVELNFHPETAATYVGSWDGTTEVPTLPTQLERLQEQIRGAIAKINEIDFKGLIDSLTTTSDSVREFASSPDLKGAIVSAGTTLDSIRDLSKTVDKNVKPLTSSLTATSNRIDEAGKGLEKTLTQFDKTLVSVRELVDPDAPIAVDLRKSLDELQRAASAIRSLADELDRNPSSLVFGRDTKEKHP
ncbi:MAG: MlaD family protein [Alphaproteobacteria bacterium]